MVTRIVYAVVLPAFNEVTPFVLVIAKSATGFTVSVSLAILSFVFGSVVPAGGSMVAVFVTLPEVAVTVAVTVNVTLPPLGNVGIITPGPCMAATVVAPQAAPPVAEPHVTLVTLRPATTGSIKNAPFAALGPLFVTRIV